MKPVITIFTSTYNRKHTLPVLYQSLKRQNYLNFEWVIVDDGSTDNTNEIIKEFINEQVVSIKYLQQPNKGKQQAINYGALNADGELFFIIDSDDHIVDNALDLVLNQWFEIRENIRYAGLCFRKVDIVDYKIIGRQFPQRVLDSNSLEITYKYHVIGDKAEIFRTKTLRENPFPCIKGEKFIPEAYLWNKIAENYLLRYVDEGIYLCKYLDDGYTKNFKKNLIANPKGFRLYYTQILKYKIVPFTVKVKVLIRIFQTFYYQWIRKRD